MVPRIPWGQLVSSAGERTTRGAHQICHEIRFSPSFFCTQKTQENTNPTWKIIKNKSKKIVNCGKGNKWETQTDGETDSTEIARRTDSGRDRMGKQTWGRDKQTAGQSWWRHTKCMWQKKESKQFLRRLLEKDYVVCVMRASERQETGREGSGVFWPE